MDRCRRVVEVVLKRRECLSKTFAALRPRRVLDEVLGEVTEGRVVAKLHRLVKGQESLRRRHRGHYTRGTVTRAGTDDVPVKFARERGYRAQPRPQPGQVTRSRTTARKRRPAAPSGPAAPARRATSVPLPCQKQQPTAGLWRSMASIGGE